MAHRPSSLSSLTVVNRLGPRIRSVLMAVQTGALHSLERPAMVKIPSRPPLRTHGRLRQELDVSCSRPSGEDTSTPWLRSMTRVVGHSDGVAGRGARGGPLAN